MNFSNINFPYNGFFFSFFLFLFFLFFLLFFLFFFLFFPHLWHMEVPGLGVVLELQLPTYTTATATQDPSHICDLHRSSQQRWTLCPIKQGQG